MTLLVIVLNLHPILQNRLFCLIIGGLGMTNSPKYSAPKRSKFIIKWDNNLWIYSFSTRWGKLKSSINLWISVPLFFYFCPSQGKEGSLAHPVFCWVLLWVRIGYFKGKDSDETNFSRSALLLCFNLNCNLYIYSLPSCESFSPFLWGLIFFPLLEAQSL